MVAAGDGRREYGNRRRPPGSSACSSHPLDALNQFPPTGLARRSNRRERLALAEWNLPFLGRWGWAIGTVQVAIEPPPPGFRACLARLSTSTYGCRGRHSSFSLLNDRQFTQAASLRLGTFVRLYPHRLWTRLAGTVTIWAWLRPPMPIYGHSLGVGPGLSATFLRHPSSPPFVD